MRALDWRFFLEGDILQKVDISSMAHSLEARVPFLDQDFIKIAMHLPDKELFDHKRTKKILKTVLCQTMDNDFVYRPKVGFMLPIEKWIHVIANDLKSNFNDLIIWDLNLLDPHKVKLLLKNPKHTFESAYFLFGIFTLNCWLEKLYSINQNLKSHDFLQETTV